jgi:hypothetical protein
MAMVFSTECVLCVASEHVSTEVHTTAVRSVAVPGRAILSGGRVHLRKRKLRGQDNDVIHDEYSPRTSAQMISCTGHVVRVGR